MNLFQSPNRLILISCLRDSGEVFSSLGRKMAGKALLPF
jgi:hypothetical protein